MRDARNRYVPGVPYSGIQIDPVVLPRHCLTVTAKVNESVEIPALEVLVRFAPFSFSVRTHRREFNGQRAVIVVDVSAARNLPCVWVIPIVKCDGRSRTLIVRDFEIEYAKRVCPRMVVEVSADLAG